MNREDRKALSRIWTPVVMGPLRSVKIHAEFHTRTAYLGKGLTPKERAYVQKRLDQLEEIIVDLERIDFRLRSMR